jgi:D-sedoheptulose 7-phosphate isomerase
LSLKELISHQINDNIYLHKALLKTCAKSIEECVYYFVKSLRNGGKILFCGNGGSAADSQHLAAELVVRLRSTFNRSAIPAIALTVDSSILTAAGNDFGFKKIFSRQIEALGNSDDVLVVISTSGNSLNIIEAAKTARKKNIPVVGFLGGSGGKVAPIVDLPVIVPSGVAARIQEAHILIGHIICELVEVELQNSKGNRTL